jgi:hypothetical protein
MNRYRMHINGESVEARRGAWFPVYDPSTEEIIAEAPDTDEHTLTAPCKPRARLSIPAPGHRPRPRSAAGSCFVWRSAFARIGHARRAGIA